MPVELSSDGGPEFDSVETKDFLSRWGVRHRISSSYFPSSNGRAELAVKATKRLLMNNVDKNGDLDNDKMVRALLIQRNTPDPGCKLSPAEILFGHQLRDTLPLIRKDIDTFDNQQFAYHWREAWRLKEESLKARYVKTMESLNEHSRPTPPLTVGDTVFIQNQTGQFPTRWDRSGQVVAVKDHNQYLVKVAGTGRLTLRNRQFLRKYKSHNLLQTQFTPSLSPGLDNTPTVPVPSSTPLTTPHHTVQTNDETHAIAPSSPEQQQPQPSALPSTVDASTDTPTALPNSTAPLPSPPQPRRSTRVRRPPKLYEPETGKFVPQSP